LDKNDRRLTSSRTSGARLVFAGLDMVEGPIQVYGSELAATTSQLPELDGAGGHGSLGAVGTKGYPANGHAVGWLLGRDLTSCGFWTQPKVEQVSNHRQYHPVRREGHTAPDRSRVSWHDVEALQRVQIPDAVVGTVPDSEESVNPPEKSRSVSA